jgi:hypothetical protein
MWWSTLKLMGSKNHTSKYAIQSKSKNFLCWWRIKALSSSQGGTSNFHIKYIDSLETFKEDNFIIEETQIKKLVKYL